MSRNPTDDAQAPAAGTDAPATAPLQGLRETVLAAAGDLAPGAAAAAVTLEHPRQAHFGDYSTNAALVLAKGLGEPPRAVAERLATELARRLGESPERFEIAGPGFVNL